MKSFITTLCFALVGSATLIAQEVKVKKGIVSLDEVKIASLQDIKNDAGVKVTHFYDNDNVEIFSYEKQFYKDNYWEKIAIPDYELTADIESKTDKASFNRDKVVADYVIKTLKFYKDGKWDRSAIKDYIAAHQEKRMDAFTAVAQQERNAAKTVEAMGLSVKADGTIFAYGKQMGTAHWEKNAASGGYRFTFKNVANVVKCVGTRALNGGQYVFSMKSDQKELKYDGMGLFETGQSSEIHNFVSKVVSDQAAKGYWTEKDTEKAE